MRKTYTLVVSFLKQKQILFALSLLLVLPNFLSFHLEKMASQKRNAEVFEQSIVAKTLTISDVLKYTDSLAANEHVGSSSLRYGELLNRVVKRSFFHGYSYYGLNENWIAALCGKLIWRNLNAIVIPDDILKYPNAACSQQSIVMMACLQKKMIPFRGVAFDHHFAVEAMFGHHWYYFDPDLEPKFKRTHTQRESLDSLCKHGRLPIIYAGILDSVTLQRDLGRYHYERVNQLSGTHARLFHYTTKLLSRTLWLLPLIVYGWKRRRQQRGLDGSSKDSSIYIIPSLTDKIA